MEHQTRKELVRQWLHQRQCQSAPPPDMAHIRRALGWQIEDKVQQSRHAIKALQDPS